MNVIAASIAGPSRRSLAASSRLVTTSQRRHSSIRAYRYHVDVHGQLFLHDTVPKNLSSCFKNAAFLDFFFARIKPNEGGDEAAAVDKVEDPEPDWVEYDGLDEARAGALARSYGYRWLSPCQGEFNYTRADATPIVFRELSGEGKLRWAGSYEMDFDPAGLKVCRDTGYVYHPSPRPPLSRFRRDTSLPTPYGRYSLLSSALVLQRLTDGLDVDPDAFNEGKGGSIEWRGRRHDMGVIEAGDLAMRGG